MIALSTESEFAELKSFRRALASITLSIELVSLEESTTCGYHDLKPYAELLSDIERVYYQSRTAGLVASCVIFTMRVQEFYRNLRPSSLTLYITVKGVAEHISCFTTFLMSRQSAGAASYTIVHDCYKVSACLCTSTSAAEAALSNWRISASS